MKALICKAPAIIASVSNFFHLPASQTCLVLIVNPSSESSHFSAIFMASPRYFSCTQARTHTYTHPTYTLPFQILSTSTLLFQTLPTWMLHFLILPNCRLYMYSLRQIDTSHRDISHLYMPTLLPPHLPPTHVFL